MGPSEGWSSRRLRGGLLLCLLAGCVTGRPALDRALRGEKFTATRPHEVSRAYAVACPDLLELAIAGRPELDGRREVGTDGRINLGMLGRLRVEGRGLEEIADDVAEVAGVPVAAVHVRVAEYRSRQIYLFGQAFGQQRAVAYRGPETVTDLLQRVGGVAPGAAAEDVSVVRTRVTQGRAPEVFRVDLPAILSGKDARTNLRLEPFDEIYVGETKQSAVSRCVPPCFKPIYQRLSGLYRSALPIGSARASLPPPRGDRDSAPLR